MAGQSVTFSDSDQQQYHYKLLQIAVILLLVIIKLFVPFLTGLFPISYVWGDEAVL